MKILNLEKSKGFLTMNQKKRMKRNKRKNSTTPNREEFVKKPKIGLDVV